MHNYAQQNLFTRVCAAISEGAIETENRFSAVDTLSKVKFANKVHSTLQIKYSISLTTGVVARF